MESCIDVRSENSILSHAKKHITREETKSLVSSSIFSTSDQGSTDRTTLQAGEVEICPDAKWHYMFIFNRDFRRFIDIFTGKEPLIIKDENGTTHEKRFFFKVFAYTSAEHKKRFEKCTYSKEEYKERKASAQIVKEAFTTDSTEKLNQLVERKKIQGNGYLFVCGPLQDILLILDNTHPRHYLVTNSDNSGPATIPTTQMEEFIYLYESMPYNIELMEHPLEEYKIKQKKIRITSGLFAGKEGRIMRLHRNHKLVFAFGNMTVALSDIKAFPHELID